MKGYIKQTLFIAIFGVVAFLGSVKPADAFSLNIGLGLGAYNYSNYGNYGNYNVPVNCYVAGPGCNTGYSYNNNYNNYGYNTNYGNGYGNYGYGATNYNNYGSPCFYNCYVAPTQTYYSGYQTYNSYPNYNYGSYSNNYSSNTMYSNYNNYSYWYGY